MHTSGTEPLSVILNQTRSFKKSSNHFKTIDTWLQLSQASDNI